jgi:hypothetical protein
LTANVYDKKINSRYSEKIFAFPEVKAGSIEYKYILDNSSQDEWYFQRSIPVQFSRFIINFPPNLLLHPPYCSLLLRGNSDRKEQVIIHGMLWRMCPDLLMNLI